MSTWATTNKSTDSSDAAGMGAGGNVPSAAANPVLPTCICCIQKEFALVPALLILQHHGKKVKIPLWTNSRTATYENMGYSIFEQNHKDWGGSLTNIWQITPDESHSPHGPDIS